MAENDPANNEDLMSEFAAFLEQKRASEQKAQAEEDFDVEIWDEKGRGVRTKRSHAKPFLQSLGIDLDAESGSDDESGNSGGNKGTGTKKTATRKPPAGSESTVRKYFAPKK